MNKQTLDIAINTVAMQKKHCNDDPDNEKQKAYYDGMLAMLELIYSKGFQDSLLLSEISSRIFGEVVNNE